MAWLGYAYQTDPGRLWHAPGDLLDVMASVVAEVARKKRRNRQR